MPHAELPLRRHTLVTLTAAGWGEAFARDPLVDLVAVGHPRTEGKRADLQAGAA